MATLEGFTDFFHTLGVTARFFDLGRRIQPISSALFTQCDRNTLPYPTPYLGHAHVGMVFWESRAAGDNDDLPQSREDNTQPDQHMNPMLWSLRFPLDEQGFLCTQARQQFMQQILVAMGKNVSAAQSGKALQSVLDNNPFAVKLAEDRQAAYFAKVSQALDRPASAHLQTVVDYLQQVASGACSNHDASSNQKPNVTEPQPLIDWNTLSLQGMAELTCRHQTFEEDLIQAVPHLPQPVFSSLCHLLEHEAISQSLSEAIIRSAMAKQTAPNPALSPNPWLPAAIRALSFSPAMDTRQQFIQEWLHAMNNPSQSADIESVIAIASRCPQDLTNASLARDYLEVLSSFGVTTFTKVTTDLLRLSEIRPHLLRAFRHPQRSELLAQCIGALYQSFQNSPVTH